MDGPDLLDVPLGKIYVGAEFVVAQHEVRTVFFEVAAFREANAGELCIMLEASRLERHSRTWVGIAAFAVAGRSGTAIAVPTLCEPTSERFSEFFENALTGLRMQVRIAVVAFEFPVIGDLARVVPLFLCVV